jgi:hypothetical protein
MGYNHLGALGPNEMGQPKESFGKTTWGLLGILSLFKVSGPHEFASIDPIGMHWKYDASQYGFRLIGKVRPSPNPFGPLNKKSFHPELFSWLGPMPFPKLHASEVGTRVRVQSKHSTSTISGYSFMNR